jgi:hypothetical protein
VRRAVLRPLKPGIMRDGEVTCKPSEEVKVEPAGS